MSGKISHDRACEMINALFAEKLKEKEDEVELISQRIKDVQSALQLVRYGAVTNLSNQTQIYVSNEQDYHTFCLVSKILILIIGTTTSFSYPFTYVIDTRHIVFTPKYLATYYNSRKISSL